MCEKGFRKEYGPLSRFSDRDYYPPQIGKLAQEGSPLAWKRNTANFLVGASARSEDHARSSMLRGIIGEVPLDGAETKSEDYQRISAGVLRKAQ